MLEDAFKKFKLHRNFIARDEGLEHPYARILNLAGVSGALGCQLELLVPQLVEQLDEDLFRNRIVSLIHAESLKLLSATTLKQVGKHVNNLECEGSDSFRL